MKKGLPHIILLTLLVSCREVTPEKPVWLNPAPELAVTDLQLQFRCSGKNWKAVLLNFTQPVPLSVRHNDTGITISAVHKKGVTEGPAQLCLSTGDHYFFYPVHLRNSKPVLVSKKDYRSPKTVNPDSSLYQQKIIHDIDEYRNLAPLKNYPGYFAEEEILLPPQAGTSRAIKAEPLSSFYVQPGSCTAIPISAVYIAATKSFSITAGPLQDKYGNTAANGTRVAFSFTDGQTSSRMEAAVWNGYSTISIPSTGNTRCSIKAMINQTVSKTLNLIP